MVEPSNKNSGQVQQVATNGRGYVNIADFLNANQHLLDQENQRQRQI